MGDSVARPVDAKKICHAANANRSEPTRSGANQCELPLDAPMAEVLAVRSEADAVRKCLRLALRIHGRDQQTVALMCGWKSDSCLSEIASETNKRGMPKTRVARFALATGCNLVSQYRERIASEQRAKGMHIQRDEADRFADLFVNQIRKAA